MKKLMCLHINHCKRKECLPQFPRDLQYVAIPQQHCNRTLAFYKTKISHIRQIFHENPPTKNWRSKTQHMKAHLDDMVLNPRSVSKATVVKTLTINPPRSALSTTPHSSGAPLAHSCFFWDPDAIPFSTIFCA